MFASLRPPVPMSVPPYCLCSPSSPHDGHHSLPWLTRAQSGRGLWETELCQLDGVQFLSRCGIRKCMLRPEIISRVNGCANGQCVGRPARLRHTGYMGTAICHPTNRRAAQVLSASIPRQHHLSSLYTTYCAAMDGVVLEQRAITISWDASRSAACCLWCPPSRGGPLLILLSQGMGCSLHR